MLASLAAPCTLTKPWPDVGYIIYWELWLDSIVSKYADFYLTEQGDTFFCLMVGLHIIDMIPADHDLNRMIGCYQNIRCYEYAWLSGSGVWSLLLFRIHQPSSVQAGQLCSEQSRSLLVTLDCCVPWTKESKWVYRCWQVEDTSAVYQWDNENISKNIERLTKIQQNFRKFKSRKFNRI